MGLGYASQLIVPAGRTRKVVSHPRKSSKVLTEKESLQPREGGETGPDCG